MLVGVLVWHRRSPQWHPWLTYLVVVVFGALLYVPGMVWFELITVFVMHRAMLRHFQRSSLLSQVLWTFCGLILISPLVLSLAAHSHLIPSLLGLPASMHDIKHIPKNLLDTVLSVGIRSNGSAITWLGHSPLLNVMELILGAIGVYYYLYLERSLRSVLITAALIVGTALASLGGSVTIACIVPLLYLLITGGLHHLLGEWLSVFPRNPIARGAGVGLICIMLAFSVLYQVRSYFVAWPHNSITRQTFDVREL
jgi:hypothetical protein